MDTTGENSGPTEDPATPAASVDHTDQGQIQLIVEVRAKPGAQDHLRESLDRLVEATHRDDDGCLRFEVAVDPSDDTRYVGYEIWASQGDLDRHAAKAHTKRFLEEASDMVMDPSKPLSVTRWTPLDPPKESPYPARRQRRASDTARQPTATPAPAPEGFSHHYATVNDVSLHYVIGGAGEPVVLLHGFPSTWYAWREVMPTLAQQYTVVAVDLRGLGDSERPGSGYDLHTTSEDIYHLVEHLGFGPVFLAGQDWGGSTAFAYAAAHPAKVRGLAVIEAMPAGPWTEEGTGKGEAWFATFHQIPDLPETLVAGRESAYLGWLYQAFSATPGVPTPEAIEEYLRTYEAPGAMTAAFGRYRTVPEEIRYNAEHNLAPLEVPVLAIGGERVFGEAVAENLRRAASNVRSEVLEGCGHYLTEERPENVTRLLIDFFEEGRR